MSALTFPSASKNLQGPLQQRHDMRPGINFSMFAVLVFLASNVAKCTLSSIDTGYAIDTNYAIQMLFHSPFCGFA